MAEWQSIEPAPKDGTRILAIVPDPDDNEQTIRFVAWGKTSHVPMYGFCLADQGPEHFDLCKPTRWMPLPALPEPDGVFDGVVVDCPRCKCGVEAHVICGRCDDIFCDRDAESHDCIPLRQRLSDPPEVKQ